MLKKHAIFFRRFQAGFSTQNLDVFATPLKDKTADETAKTLLMVWANHPEINPTTIMHDNGSEFKGLFSAMIEKINVDQNWSIAGRPESHGIIERSHQDICAINRQVYTF